MRICNQFFLHSTRRCCLMFCVITCMCENILDGGKDIGLGSNVVTLAVNLQFIMLVLIKSAKIINAQFGQISDHINTSPNS